MELLYYITIYMSWKKYLSNSQQLKTKFLFFTFNIKIEWAGDDITVRCPNTFVFSCIMCVGSHNCQAENHK